MSMLKYKRTPAATWAMKIRRRKTKYWGHRAGSQPGVSRQVPPQTLPPMGAGAGLGGGGPTHQPQQAADLVHGADAAQEAHEHGDGAHADKDVGPHVERV